MCLDEPGEGQGPEKGASEVRPFEQVIQAAYREGSLPWLRALDRAGYLVPGAVLPDQDAERVSDLVVASALRPIEPGRPLVGIWIKRCEMVVQGKRKP